MIDDMCCTEFPCDFLCIKLSMDVGIIVTQEVADTFEFMNEEMRAGVAEEQLFRTTPINMVLGDIRMNVGD